MAAYCSIARLPPHYKTSCSILNPCRSIFRLPCLDYSHFRALVGLSGLEPPTSRLSGVRSNRLSYKPIFPGFEAIRVL